MLIRFQKLLHFGNSTIELFGLPLNCNVLNTNRVSMYDLAFCTFQFFSQSLDFLK
jgi:hypothetical protein